jgi:hypothetical protein
MRTIHGFDDSGRIAGGSLLPDPGIDLSGFKIFGEDGFLGVKASRKQGDQANQANGGQIGTFCEGYHECGWKPPNFRWVAAPVCSRESWTSQFRISISLRFPCGPDSATAVCP